jgi:DNA-directed RNA polymerase specialized sigma24 family protein
MPPNPCGRISHGGSSRHLGHAPRAVVPIFGRRPLSSAWSNTDPITVWLDQLRAGDDVAAQCLWQTFSERLIKLARRKLLGQNRAVADEEDVAVAAFNSFFKGIAAGRFHDVGDRHCLWRLLVSITLNKTLRQIRDQNRLKRGGKANVANESCDDPSFVGTIVSREPSPEIVVEVAEECRRLLARLENPELAQLCLWKLEGATNDEIAHRWGRSERTVERKLGLIRKVWSQPDGK